MPLFDLDPKNLSTDIFGQPPVFLQTLRQIQPWKQQKTWVKILG
jgi:hypothetical protein